MNNGKFHFSEVHESMKTTDHVKRKRRPKGVPLTLRGNALRSYFHEPQKNEILFLKWPSQWEPQKN